MYMDYIRAIGAVHCEQCPNNLECSNETLEDMLECRGLSVEKMCDIIFNYGFEHGKQYAYDAVEERVAFFLRGELGMISEDDL